MQPRLVELFRVLQNSLLVLFGALFFASLATAQVTSGTIYGTVKDQSGALVADATVTVTDSATGVSRTVSTNDSGGFVVPNLPPGTYSVVITANGFKKVEKTGVILSAADHLGVGDFVLAVGAAADQVTVTADSGELQLQSNSGERSDLVTSKQLNDVAMNGRNVLDYMKLVPGVISGFNGAVSGTGGLDSMNINGTRANQHEFTIDGASNVDTGNNGGTHVTINPDAIEEVKILTSNYQAEFGKAAGGQIAIVTKGGTNQWHGDARFFHRNEGLNANEYFNKKSELAAPTPYNTPPLYRYNYIGYQIGGPVRKDKLFVFWNEEFYRQYIPIGLIQFYTPTPLERQGDFSQSVVPGPNNAPMQVAISGPGITNNKIDPTKLSSAQQAVFTNVQKILNLFPQPNVSGFGVNQQNYNYSASVSGHDPRREDILRVDYQLNTNNRLFGRWIHNADNNSSPFTPFPGPFGIFACSSSVEFPGGCTQRHPGWNLSLNLVSTLTPTLLNEFSVGPSHTLSIADGANGNISLAKNGINLPLLYPSATIPDMGFNFAGENVNFGGGYLGATPWEQANTTINVNDNFTWVKRTHTLKFGMFYQRNRKNQIAWGNINGQFSFSNGPTSPATCPVPLVNNQCPDALGDPLASALLGSFDGFGQSTARPWGYFRYNQLEFYAQDTWKLTPRFTLDYGMRFAWIPPQYDAKNQVGLFDPTGYKPATAVKIDGSGNIVPNSGDPLDGMKFAGNGLPRGGWDDRGVMPEPRLGFAYDPFGNHKTVFRGGFGMMHDRTQGNLIFNTVFNNPALVQTAQLGSGNITNLANPSFGSGVLSNILGASRNGKVPTVYSFSFGVQREIARGTTLDVAYVGTLGRHFVTARDINTIPYGYAFTRAAQDPANFTSYCSSPAPGNPCTNGLPAVEPGLPAEYAAAGYSFSGTYAYGRQSYSNAPLVPYKGYGQIQYLQFDGTSNYNSLQTSLQRRFSKGFTFGVVYTYSKALTTANSDQDMQDPFNQRAFDYRAAGWDRTHVFAANYVYDLPNVTKRHGGAKWLSYITDNYQLSGVTQFMTGTPVDLNNSWNWEPGAADGSNMWGAIPYFYTLDKNLNPVLPPIGSRIRASRDTLRSGGLQDWDLSLFKNIPFGEASRYSIQLRLEAFNAFNHPNFNDRHYADAINSQVNGPWQWTFPPGQAGSGSYSPTFSISKASNWGTPVDTYSGVGGPRVVQLGAKVYF